MSNSMNGWGIMVAHVPAPRHSVRTVVLILALANLLTTRVTALPVEEFYPFDTASDSQTEIEDDGGSPLLNLTVPFPFFGAEYHHLYVNNNAIISFDDKIETYKPLNFSLFDFYKHNFVPLVAPFWSDTDIKNVHGKVFYRVTNSSDVIDRATRDVSEYFKTTFTPTQVLIVTWYNVGYYGATGAGFNKTNLFQAVMVTDGKKSYIVFNYNRIVWTTGSNSQGNPKTGLGGQPAVVGFYSGNSSMYYLWQYSGTDAVISIANQTNMGVPGKFIFRVDGTTVDIPVCFDPLTSEPENIPMLGQSIRLKGPCPVPGKPVRARIRALGLNFLCEMVEQNESVCVVPPVFRTGEVTLEYDPDGSNTWRYKTVLYVDHIAKPNSPQSLVREQIDNWQPGRMVRVLWDTADIVDPLEQNMLLEVLAYSYVNDEASFEHIQSVVVPYGDSSRKFKLMSDFSTYSSLIVRLCWSSALHRNTSPVCIWSDVFPVRWKSENSVESGEWCQNWLAVESARPRLNVTKQSCPCSLTIAENDSGHLAVDPYCDNQNNKHKSNLTCVNNLDAKMCFRRNLKSSTVTGETCCYNSDGELMDIRDGSGAGTHGRYHYQAQEPGIVPFFSHYEADVLPKLHCCRFSKQNCSDFISYRNVTTCAGYTPSSLAQAAGDPHLVTLDGKNYSFNGIGDFYLVRDLQSTFLVQVEASPAVDKDGVVQNATVFTRVAVQMPDVSDTVEIRKGDSGAEILVNGVTLSSSTSQFKNISLSTNDDGSYLVVLEPISVSLTVYVTPDLINLIVLIGEDSLKGSLSGLLGNYNGDTSDDFISRNGTVLPADSTMRDIHYKFGMTWLVPASESIFTRPAASSPDGPFIPLFIDEVAVSEENKDLCGDNIICSFDFSVTKNEDIARGTLEISEKFESLKKSLEDKVIRCLEYLESPSNGNRTVSGNSNGSTATFVCDAGYEMIQGSGTRVCQTDGTWSGSTVLCAIKVVTASDNTTVIIVVTTSSSIVVLLVVVLTVYCVRKRRKRKPETEEDIPMPVLNIPVFENPAFMQNLHVLVREGGFRIPRPNYVDPNIYQEYF